MEDQQFCLKWSNHHSNMVDIFGHLLTDEALCDVTLACDGFSFKAHKLVLSASSSFFQNLFLENPCTHPVIILPELKYMDMKALVDFMYNGQVNVSESQLPKLLKAAENLRIKGLSDCRLQYSTDHSDTSEASPDVPFLKMDCSELLETPKKIFDKDSDNSSCNLESREHQKELFNSDVCTDNQGSTASNHQSSVDQNSDVGTLGQTSQHVTDGNDLTLVSDADIEMEPSKMMEQTMTTNHVFKSQSIDPDQILHEDSISNEAEDNMKSDNDCANLPDSSDNVKEDLTSVTCFSQDPCFSKDDGMSTESISSDQVCFADATSCSKEEILLCKKEPDVSVAGPSTLVFETSSPQIHYSQVWCHECRFQVRNDEKGADCVIANKRFT